MKLYVIRHGQTDSNTKSCINYVDEDINETGIVQASIAAEELKDIKFDYIISSPMKRTYHTTKILNVNNYDMLFDKRLVEIDGGVFNGKPVVLVKGDDYWFNYYNKPIHESMESAKGIMTRVSEFIEDIKEKYKDKTILVVTHAGVIRCMFAHFNGIPEDGNLNLNVIDNCKTAVFDLGDDDEKKNND